MSDATDSFVEVSPEVVSAESVTEGEYIHVYRGELEKPDVGQVRILSLAPEITDSNVREAFIRKAGQWENPSTHPKIVTVHERGTSPRPWLAVTDVDAQTLAGARAELSMTETGTVIADTAEAIRNANLYNTVHSALSPEVIWITESGSNASAVVDDWGLERTCQVTAGETILTPFSAPELVERPEGESEHTDVYGLGAVAYYALTGQPPISAEDDLASALEEGDVTPPSTLNPTVTEAVDDVLLQALSRDPQNRHQSSHEFQTVFTSALPVQEDIEPSEAATIGDEQTVNQDDGSRGRSSGPRSEASGDRTSSDRVHSSSGAGTDTNVETDDGSRISRRAILVTVGLAGAGGIGLFALPSGSDQTDESGGTATEQSTSTPVATSTAAGESGATETPEDGQSASQDETSTETPTPNPDIDWVSTFRYDAANTGSQTRGSGPTTFLTEEWVYKTGAGVFSSPALVDGVVYIGSNDGNVYALNASDGSERWVYQTEDRVRSSPVVVDGTVYVGSDDGSLYAINADNGTREWSFSTRRSIFSSPAVMNSTVYVGSADNSLYALDIVDGSEQWSFETAGSIQSSPAVVDGAVCIGSNDNSVYIVDAADGTQQWSFETAGSVRTSPTVVDNTIYVGSNDTNLYALNFTDSRTPGENWSYSTDSRLFSTPAVVSGVIVFGSGTDVIAVNASDGSERWTFGTSNGRVLSSPAVVSGSAYIGCNNSGNTSEDNTVYGINIFTGTQVTHFETFQSVRSSPAVGNNVIFVGSDDTNVYALTEGV